jgi:hypothetical protein
MQTSWMWTGTSKAPPCGGTRNSASERGDTVVDIGCVGALDVPIVASTPSTAMKIKELSVDVGEPMKPLLFIQVEDAQKMEQIMICARCVRQCLQMVAVAQTAWG